MKGIILAGGSGTRLYPATKCVSKQLLLVYDKPMIYYPLSILMLAGIKEILIITNPDDFPLYFTLLEDGSQLGISITYMAQKEPRGLPEAFTIGEKFIGNDPVCLILGDNIFYGVGFISKLKSIIEKNTGSTILGYHVRDPERFGVVKIDENQKAVALEEKPKHPASSYAVTGLYFYDNQVIEYAKNLTPSKRGELEITDLNRIYMEKNQLNVELLGRGFAWLDTGTHKSLMEASQFIETLENRQRFKIACLEEIAYTNGWIDEEMLLKHARELEKTEYGQYLLEILEIGKKEKESQLIKKGI